MTIYLSPKMLTLMALFVLNAASPCPWLVSLGLSFPIWYLMDRELSYLRDWFAEQEGGDA